MDNPAVGGGHWFQGNAPTGLTHPFGHLIRHIPQGGFPALTIPFYVQRYPDSLAKLFANNHIDDELQGLEGLSPASNQQAGVFAGQVYNRAAHFRVIGRPDGANHVDSGDRKDVVQRRQAQANCGAFAGFGRGIGAGALDRSRGRDRLGLGRAFRDGNSGFGRCFRFTRVRGQPGYPDPGHFGADAQETGLAST